MSMSSVVDTLRDKLAPRGDTRWCVALSGGLDSTVLLHALHELAGSLDGAALRAVHVHHGLHADADHWTGQCEAVARELGVPLAIRRVDVDLESGEGTEAAARRARYAAFESLLDDDETLLTAHHAEDQAETVLMRLLRGAGVRGLGSIVERQRFGRGWLVRPLLSVSRTDVRAYARDRGLTWVEDPSNRDTDIDRNYLRHEVFPVLRRRWPGIDAALGRTARLSAEAAELLHAMAAQDSAAVLQDGLISLPGLRRLQPARQRNLVRFVLRERGLGPPSEAQLSSGLTQLLTARDDRNPILRWPGGQIRRYRDRLYVLDVDPERSAVDAPVEYRWDGSNPLELGPVRGRLRLENSANGPIELRVSFRRGGETLLEADHIHHKRLKKMFQSGGVVPWMRAHVPLIFHGTELVAVADLWSSAQLAERLGESARIRWEDHAKLY